MIHHRQNRTCSYDARSTYFELSTSNDLLTPSSGNEIPREPEKQFPSVYFLDSILFHRSGTQFRNSESSIDAGLSILIGNVYSNKEFISSYFSFVHPWIPFLSKKRFTERVINPLGATQTENTLLIASMKLVAETVLESDPRTSLYNSVKTTFLRLEILGILEFRILQAMILLTLYEIGHGIYPAAYMTIGNCIRYGSALEVDLAIENTTTGSFNAVDLEERRRSWWSILLLDR